MTGKLDQLLPAFYHKVSVLAKFCDCLCLTEPREGQEMNGIKSLSYIRMSLQVFCAIVALCFLTSCALLPTEEDIKNRHEPLFSPSDVFSPEEEPRLEKELKPFEKPAHDSLSYMEEEIGRLSAKVKSLEAKVAVLQEKLSTDRIAHEQPVIEAEERTFITEARDTVNSYHSAPQRKQSKALVPVRTDGYNEAVLAHYEKEGQALEEDVKDSSVENEFQQAMILYERGSYVEAKSRFFRFYKKYPKHVLASHALYWAGKASEQKKAWREAIRYWMLLESRYSFRSIYMPEVWEGLSRAFSILGELKKAKKYKELLRGIFPQSSSTTASYKNL